MPNVYPTSVSAVSDGFTVTIFGLNELLASLSHLNPTIEKELKREIREAGNKVLQETRGLAYLGHSPSGAYSHSFSMTSQKSGVRIRSNDAGAGTIEFANAGARYLRGPRYGRPIGTPAVGKPKALIKAANENEPIVLEKIQTALQRACDTVRGA